MENQKTVLEIDKFKETTEIKKQWKKSNTKSKESFPHLFKSKSIFYTSSQKEIDPRTKQYIFIY